jgi:hypothetical protein
LAPAALSARPEHTERLAALESWIEDFHHGHGDDELAWITTPSLIVRSRVRYEERSAGRPLAPERARAVLEKHRLNVDPRWALYDGHLFLASTDNQRWAQLPIARRLGEAQRSSGPVRIADTRLDELGERGIALADELLDAARRASLMVHERRRVYLQFVGAAANLASFEARMEADRPRAVVIGSTHSIPARALVLAARRAGIPSVYVPHAPVIADARLVDLPVDFAALRGPREIDYYRSFGADEEGLEAIGNPAVEPSSGGLADLRSDQPLAYALPLLDDATLTELVSVVRDALGANVIASPHPRADRDALRALLHPGWRLWEGRTFDLLRQGTPSVIQASSGVALEAAQLGVPSIELAFPGEQPKYPFLADAEVRSVSSADQLRDAAHELSQITAEQRHALRDWARGWVFAEGSAAAEAGAALIRRAVAEGPMQRPLWDAW